MSKSNSKLDVLEALRLFLLQIDADGRSQHTIDQYRRHVRLFARWCGNKQLAEIDHEDVAVFLTSPEARNRPDGKQKKATSTNTLRTSIRCFLSYCHRAGLIDHDPARMVRRARCGAPPPRSLNMEEQDRLQTALREAQGPTERRDAVLFLLLLKTGIRVGSALALDAEDVDLERGELNLRTTKGDRPDMVFMIPEIRELMAKYIDNRENGHLFTTQAGQRLTTRHARRRFLQWQVRAKIQPPATLHTLRHSFGQGLYDRTGDIALVQRALLHRSICSTLAYARPSDQRLREAMSA